MDPSQKTMMFKSNAVKAMALSPDLPWNQTSAAELGPCVTSFVQSHETYFRRWAESWFMTMQYVFGNHNFQWSPRLGFAVDFDFMRNSKQPSNFTRSYTNIARIAIESLTAALYSNIPTWDVEAMDDSATAGRQQKKIASRLLEGLFHTLQMDKDAGAAAFVFAMFGQMATDASWNPMSGRVIEQPRYMKRKQPAFTSWMAPNQATGGLIETPTMITDTQGRPYLEDTWEIQRDGMGREIIDKIFTGGPGVNILTPFEYRRAVGSIGMHKTRYAQIFRLVDYDQWLDTYGQMSGKTKFFGAVQPAYMNASVYDFAMRFYMRMMYVTPPSLDYGSRWSNTGLGGTILNNKVLIVEHYDEPHPVKWPEGRRLIIANGACTHITKPQYNTGKLDGWHPLTEAQWLNAYPSSIASGPMQDLVKKNHEVDVIDSFISTAVRRNLGGQFLVKIGSGIDPNRLTGEPGIAHEVTDPYGIRVLHDEIPIPPVVQAIRQMNMDDAYNQSGALEATRGNPDFKANSGYQAKLYEEREEKRLAPAKKAFRNAFAGTGEKLLYALKANVIQLDDGLMGYMIANSAGEFTPQDVISFMSKPLGVGTQIKIVEGSLSLKSKATEQATLQELAGGPLQNRLAMDAEVLDKYLKFFGIDTLRDKSAPHRDRAERENETFLDMVRLGFDTEGIAKPIVAFEDDDQIHIDKHTDFFVKNFEQFRSNKAFLMEYYIHVETHRLQQQEKAAQLMPGASLETGAMVQQASMIPKPAMQTIAMDAQVRKQMAAGQGPTQDPKQAGTPPGAAPTNAGTPAAKTPPGQQQAGA